ncbi:MAG: T9SS type A sorting domain-containing protein [Bacteroidota bacterium]
MAEDYNVNAPSPFFSPNAVFEPNTHHLALVNGAKDFQREDGWEVLFVNFGTQQFPVAEPSYALYNRYNGLVRTFIYLTANSGPAYQSAVVEVGHSFIPGFENATNIFETLNAPMSALDNFEKGVRAEAFNQYWEAAGTWIMSEFTAGYDPCACEIPSALEVRPILASTSEVELTIEGTSSTTQIVNSSGTPVSASNNGFFSTLGNAVGTGADIVSKGAKVYKDNDGFKSFVENVVGWLFGKDTDGDGHGDTNKEASQNTDAGLPDWLKSVPMIGTAVSVLDLIIGGGKKTAEPTVTEFSSKYKFEAEGSITTLAPYQSVLIYTPGSDHTGFPTAHVPIYDNPLGVATLVKTPVVTRHEYPHSGLNPGIVMIDLEDELEYAINTTAGISGTPVAITASIFMTACDQGNSPANAPSTMIEENDSVWRTPFLQPGCLSDYIVRWDDYFTNHCPGEMYLRVKMTLERTPADPDAREIFFMGTYKVDVNTITYSDPQQLPNFVNPWDGENPLSLEAHAPTYTGCYPVPAITAEKLEDFCDNVYDPSAPTGTPGVAQGGGVKKTDLMDAESEMEFEVFPNPVTEVLYVRGLHTDVEFRLYDLHGKQVRQFFSSEADAVLDLVDLQTGMYLLQVLNSEGELMKVKKILKE